MVVTFLITTAVYYSGKYTGVTDHQIINGQVTNKSRVHDDYIETYECHCKMRTRKDGTRYKDCDTCRRKHYTVDWTVATTIGIFRIDRVDSLSSAVYSLSDPSDFIAALPGDPVSKKVGYTNWILAAPDSIDAVYSSARFDGQIPAYPSNIYGRYKLDRLVNNGVPITDAALWNRDISNMLRTLGPEKQANVVVVLTKNGNMQYGDALVADWKGGKKNDIIVVIGTPEYPKISWVKVQAWTDKEMFKVRLRDDIMALNTLSREGVIKMIDAGTRELYVRKPMKDFEHYADTLDPPNWVIWTALLFSFLTSSGMLYLSYKHDFNSIFKN